MAENIFAHRGGRLHFIGIGGSSMSGLAGYLQELGYTVTGSDRTASHKTEHLEERGIRVHIGHAAENVRGADVIVYSAAISRENPERAEAERLGIPQIERCDLIGQLMAGYPFAIGVSGTHGKTTTTSMAAHIFMAAQADPTVMIGGTLPLLRNAGYRVGKGETIILESCEYCNSFLNFFPTVAVILNVAEDHLDFFKDLQDIEHSFRSFAELVPQNGYVVGNWDDKGARETLAGYEGSLLWFSRFDRSADCYADNVAYFDGLPAFDIVIRGEKYAHVELLVGGDHNISNALAAACSAYLLGIGAKAVENGLNNFLGAGRRFERKGSYHGADVYDDYAHHPDELHALLTMARQRPYERIICAFQPHTYSRTEKLFDRFVEELKLPDITVLAEIYAARETNEKGTSSRDLAREIPGAIYCSSLEKVTDTLAQMARPGDLILTVGAGDIFRAGERLLERE